MKCTSEMESNDSPSYLDVLVGENGSALFIIVYSKPTNIGRHLHYEQNHPSYVKNKWNWYKVLFRQPTFQSKQDCDEEMEKMKKDLLSNAYPSCVAESFIREKSRIREIPPPKK